MTNEALADLRERLVHMRQELLARLVERIEAGELSLLGSVGAALRAVDDKLAEDGAESAAGEATAL
jgi:hypothetical protein